MAEETNRKRWKVYGKKQVPETILRLEEEEEEEEREWTYGALLWGLRRITRILGEISGYRVL